MPKKVLTDRALKALKPAPVGKRYEIMDAIVPGLGVRVTENGVRTFMLVARYPGSRNPTRRALGEYGALTLDDAREKARTWLILIGKGSDPHVQKERERQEAARRQKNSFAAVAEDFIKREVAKKRRGSAMERELRQEFVARWADRPVTEITQHDVLAVLDEAVDRGAPYQAHALFGHVRRLFNWAIGRGCYEVERSPCDRLRPKDAIGSRTARTRTLLDDELRALWRASGKLDYPFGPLFRLLLLTGLRRGEVSDARWSEFGLEETMGHSGAAYEGQVAACCAIDHRNAESLETLPHFEGGDFLFSTTFGKRPVSGFSKVKARLDKSMLRTWRAIGRIDGKDRRRASVNPWVIHDTRRTVRTNLSALPVTDLVRELVIAHAKPGLHKIYDQYAYLDEKRHALELWMRRLKSIVEPLSPDDKILPLRNAT